MINQLRYITANLRQSLLVAIINTSFRRNNWIERNCIINKNSIFGGNVRLARNVIIGSNVKLGQNVIIGSGAFLRNINVGLNTHIERGVIVTGFGEGKISIGEECYIGLNNVLDFSDDIKIGNYVHIAGPSTALWTHSSAKMCLNGDNLNNKTQENRPTKPIIIEDNVYIGGNCTIYPGIKICHHSVIAPNSAVTKDVDPFTLVGGVPAKVIKNLNGV